MMWHLGKWQPPLRLMSQVQVATDSGVLLKTFQYAEYMRKPKCPMVQRHEQLRTKMASNVVDQILQPMVLIGIAGQRMLSPVMDRVQVLPEPGVNVVCTVTPIHAEGHNVVVQGKLPYPHKKAVADVF